MTTRLYKWENILCCVYKISTIVHSIFVWSIWWFYVLRRSIDTFNNVSIWCKMYSSKLVYLSFFWEGSILFEVFDGSINLRSTLELRQMTTYSHPVRTRDRAYLSIVRTRTDPTFWPIFVRTYLPSPTYLLDILNISFIEKLPKIITESEPSGRF